MQITDLLKRESVELFGSAASKQEALDKLIQLMVKQGNIADPEEYRKKVFARETEGSTILYQFDNQERQVIGRFLTKLAEKIEE